ncbi:MAG: hypothetical protein COB49_00610 [Alphaproteobacteria bacterium]|nr:MAG: hypothetical protein COB49_00610 [Alphaproteobacteria bacterium]
MTFQNYIKSKNIPIKTVADELEISQSFLYKILAGERELGPKLAARIVVWSDHALTFDDLYAEAILEESVRVGAAE